MNDSKMLRGYAQECRRLAKNMKPEHRATLLEIAQAWDRFAAEAERNVDQRNVDQGDQVGRGDKLKGDGGDEDEPSDQHGLRRGAARGKRCRAGRPPPTLATAAFAASMLRIC
jgi:hypothetical protein